MASDEKYFPGNRENLQERTEMKLPKKLKVFPEFFTAILKSTFNFEHFEKKDESHSLYVSRIMDCKICAYVNV